MPEQQKIAQDFAMSDFLLTLVLQIKSSKIINGMAKLSIKYEKITPFGGIFHVREQFSRYAGPVIDKVLGLRCTSFGYLNIIPLTHLVSPNSLAYFAHKTRCAKITICAPR